MASKLQYTPHDEIKAIHARLHATFKSGVTRPLSYRRHQLLQLARLVQENLTALEDAALADTGKQRQECAATELSPSIKSALYAAEHLEEWASPDKPKVEEWRSSWDATVYKVPKGVACIIAPWNYPFILTLNPLVGAIAAGCTAVIKPSEVSPACAAIMTELFPKYLDPSAYVVVNGAVEETTTILDLRWDHIFFTGGTKIGRIIAAAAARHLTPVTLELGGKSPVVVDTSADLELAAKRILYGKSQNSGQLCVAPDYVLVPKSIAPAFYEAVKTVYKTFWPIDPLHPDSPWGRIINPAHHRRVKALLDGTKGTIVAGGNVDGDKRIAPTIVGAVKLDDALMQEEIFGPVLPVLEVNDVDEAIEVIGSRPCPLVIYAFTNDETVKQKLLDRTTSGTLALNDTTIQLAVYELPFGGVGESGYGVYHGRSTFDTFTQLRSFINVPPAVEPHFAMRYAPYNEEKKYAMSAPTRAKIPDA